MLTVTDESGNVVRRLSGPATKGFQRVTWDLRHAAVAPVTAPPREDDDLTALFGGPGGGPLAAPGTYKVQLAKRVDGELTPLGQPQTFTAAPLQRADARRAGSRRATCVPAAGGPPAACRARLRPGAHREHQPARAPQAGGGPGARGRQYPPRRDHRGRGPAAGTADGVVRRSHRFGAQRAGRAGDPGPGAEHRTGKLELLGHADGNASP